MGEAILSRRGSTLKITGQTEGTFRFGEAINKYDPVYVKFDGTKLANPSILPAGTGYGVAFDPTGTYLAVAHSTSPYITIYKRSGDTFTKLSDPATLPAGWAYNVAFDPTGTYLAVAHWNSPYITIYKRSGDTFTKLSNPATLPTGNGRGVSFDPTGTYLAVVHETSPYITIYKRSGDTFTKLSDPATLPAGWAYNVAFDPTGTYLAVAHDTSPYITIYKRSGDTFTKLSDPATLPAGSACNVSFDPTSTYLAVTTYDFGVSIYKRSGDIFTKLSDLSNTGSARCAIFDPTGTCLITSCGTAPYIAVYRYGSDIFTKIISDLANVSGGISSAAFSSMGTYLAVTPGGSSNIAIYLALMFFKYSNLSNTSIGFKFGYAKETGVAGDIKKAVIIFK